MPKSMYKWVILIILSLFLIVQASDTYIISAVSPDLITEFHISEETLGFLFSATLVVATVLYPIWGYWYDKYSRKTLTSIIAFIKKVGSLREVVKLQSTMKEVF